MRTHVVAAALVALQACLGAWAALPDAGIDETYRAVFIDRSRTCYPIDVSGAYRLGHYLDLSQRGDKASRTNIVRCGFRDAAPNGSWSDGEVTRLRFAIEPPSGDLALDLVMWPFIAEGVDVQRVEIMANDHSVETLVLDGRTMPFHRIVIPRDLAQPIDGRLELALHYPDAISPRQLGLSNDQYEHAVFIYSLQLTPITASAR